MLAVMKLVNTMAPVGLRNGPLKPDHIRPNGTLKGLFADLACD